MYYYTIPHHPDAKDFKPAHNREPEICTHSLTLLWVLVKYFSRKWKQAKAISWTFFIKLKTKNAFEYQGFVLNLNNSLLLLVFVPESEVDPNFLFNSTSASRKMSVWPLFSWNAHRSDT